MSLRIIVTRVQPQAQHWVEMLEARGYQALALPLIEVRGLADASAVRQAWQQWSTYVAAMFVSRHAVDYFFKQNMAVAQVLPAQAAIKTRAWSTGPGTAQALLEQGVAAQLIDTPPEQSGQFDSEALWQQVQSQVKPGDKVLIVRGDSPALDGTSSAEGGTGVGRDWLTQRLRQVGAQVDFVVTYQRGAPVWTQAQHAVAQAAAADGSVWLLSSAEAIGYLQSLLPQQDWSAARALATHPRIAAAARALGFGVVAQSRPTLENVLASIESLA